MFVYSDFPSVLPFLKLHVMQRGETLLSRVYRLINNASCSLQAERQLAVCGEPHELFHRR